MMNRMLAFIFGSDHDAENKRQDSDRVRVKNIEGLVGTNG